MKKRFFTLLALLLSVGLAAPACGGDDDDDDNPADDDDDNNGSGTGGSGTGGSGTGGSGTGGSGTGGSGTGGSGTGGTGGSGGSAGDGGSGGGDQPLDEEYTLQGGDVDEDREIFPFSAVASKDGSLFVSTLGNRDNEPSRIYRFPAGGGAPEILFQVGDGDDAAVYGLAIDNQDRLYACVAQHLLSGNNNITASIYQFQSNQLGLSNLGPGQVDQNPLQSTAIENGNGAYIVNDALVEAGACGQIAFDGTSTVYAADTSGQTQFLYRFNIDGEEGGPGGQPGDTIADGELGDIRMIAWFTDGQLGAGVNFATAGITVDGSSIKFIRDDDATQLFDLTINGIRAENNLGNLDINNNFNVPGGLAAVGDGTFLVSAQDINELLLLTPDDNAFNTNTLFEEEDDNSFIEPAGIVVRGNQAIVVASQIGDINAVAAQAAKVFVVDLP